jgi:hypothetical protein
MGWFVVFSSPLFIVGVLLSGFVYSMQAGAATSDSAAVEVGERFASDWLGPILMFSAVVAILGSCGRLLYGTRITVASEAQLATGEAPRKIATDIAFGKFAGFFVGGVTMAIWFYVLLIGPIKSAPHMQTSAVLDGALFLFAAYGVHRTKSRTCAVALLLLYLYGSYEKLAYPGTFGTGAIGMTVFFIWDFCRGILSTFQ